MTDLKVDNKYAWLEPYCALYRCEPKMLEAKKDREPFNSFRLGGEVTRVFSREGEVEGVAGSGRTGRGHAPLYPARRPGVPTGATPRPMRDRRGRAQHLGNTTGRKRRVVPPFLERPGRGKAGPT